MRPPYVESPREILGVWKILFFPIYQFWFIQALFLIFIVVVALEQFRFLENSRRWLATTVLAALPVLFVRPDAFGTINMPLSFDGAAFLLPYFLFGLGLYRFAEFLGPRGVTIGAATLVVFGLALGMLELLGKFDVPHHKGSILYLAVSASLIFLLFKFRTTLHVFRALGNYAYSIYLFHFYIVIAAGIALKASKFSIRPAAFYALLFLSGLLLPIVVHLLFKRFALTRRLLLSLR